MQSILCITIWSVLVSYLWCLESTTKTFRLVMDDTAIDAPSFHQSVSTIIGCGFKCNADARCLSFTICDENDENVCRLFDKDYWEKTEVKSSRPCSYYEEAYYCDRNLKSQLVNFMASLEISLPDYLLHDQKKFSCSSLKETRPQKNHLVETVPKRLKSWFVSFDVKTIEMSSLPSGYRNIIHFTTRLNNANYDITVPAVWFLPGSSIPQITSDVDALSSSWMGSTSSGEVQSDSFTNFMIIQHQNDAGKYMYRIFIHGNEVFQKENREPEEFQNVKVYMADPWGLAANAIIRNFVHSNLE